ncbi:MAG: formylglycine-generating enzyme family protein [Elusimicrobiales bacterium]|nr:formylglycine-generating enzyme family protein [Elusimicrobiales bacterium]
MGSYTIPMYADREVDHMGMIASCSLLLCVFAPAVFAQEPAGSKSETALIPEGVFVMGSPEGEGLPNEHPQRKVYLDAFEMDKNLVTVSDYKKFADKVKREMRKQPDYSAGNHPVVNVSWADAAAYCGWAGKHLPTEAEWEKAARGGATTKWSFGSDESRLDDYAWHDRNSDNKSHPAGQKKPNQYGLYDMGGNVQEWVADWYGPYAYPRPPQRNPTGPLSASCMTGDDVATNYCRVTRGGPWMTRPAARLLLDPDKWTEHLGFRCARSKT